MNDCTYIYLRFGYNYTKIFIYMISVRPGRFSAPSWWGLVWWFPPPPLAVRWGPGMGLLAMILILPPLSLCGMVWVRVFVDWLLLASLGLLWVFDILIPMIMIIMI